MSKAKAVRGKEERHYRDLFDLAFDAIFIHGFTGNFLEVNQTACKRLGYTQEELLQMSPLDIVTPEFTGLFFKRLEELREIGSLFCETAHIHRDGTVFPVELSCRIIDHFGTPAVFSVARDLTGRKRTEKSLAFRLQLREYSLDHSLKETMQFALDLAEQLTQSQIGFMHFLQPDQKTLELQAWSSGTRKSFCIASPELNHYHVDKAGVWVECVFTRVTTIHNDYASLPNRKGIPQGHPPIIREVVIPIIRGEKIRAILGVGNKNCDYTQEDVKVLEGFADFAWDLISQIQAEEALQDSQGRFRQILDNSDTVIFLKDLEGKYLAINRRFEELFHIDRVGVVGKTDYDIFPAELAKAFQENDRRALEHGGSIAVEENVLQDDGMHFYISVKFPLYAVNQKPYAVCGIAT
ncbi:MAG: sensory box histidine kinase/response regulator, partial [uncultured bacterium]